MSHLIFHFKRLMVTYKKARSINVNDEELQQPYESML